MLTSSASSVSIPKLINNLAYLETSLTAMAEALGIASGIAGLISLTIEVFGISYKYVNGVRDASSSVRKFLNELEALQTVLRHVERITGEKNGLEVSDDAGSCLLSIRESSEYIELLQKVRYKLQQRQQSSSLRNKMKALTWPFSEKETVALTESLHRHLEIYNLALTVDNRYNHKIYLQSEYSE